MSEQEEKIPSLIAAWEGAAYTTHILSKLPGGPDIADPEYDIVVDLYNTGMMVLSQNDTDGEFFDSYLNGP